MKIHHVAKAILPSTKLALCLFFFSQFICCSLNAQQISKRNVTVNDYQKWGYLNAGEISDNSEWLSYSMAYENGLDTLFIKNTKSLKTFAFPGGTRGTFTSQDWFTYYNAQGLNIINLKTARQEVIPNAAYHVYAPLKKMLLIFIKQGKENSLMVKGFDYTLPCRIEGVKEFMLDPTGQKLLYTTVIDNKYSIEFLELSQKNQPTILMSGSNAFHNLAWHIQGKALAFMQETSPLSKSNTLHFYSVSNNKFYQSDLIHQQKYLDDSLYISSTGFKLKISDDMHRVIFSLRKKNVLRDSVSKTDVQIWNGNAKLMYPKEETRKKGGSIYYSSWQPAEDKYQVITSDSLPQLMLTGDQRYAVLSNPRQYEPQYDYEAPRDFYLLNLVTGHSDLLLKKHSGSYLHTLPSPTGKYIAYFYKKNWWIFNIETRTHINLTQNIGQSFSHNRKERPGGEEPDKILGWTVNDKELLVRDEFDIWAINIDGSSSRRLTQGRETKTRFRIAGDPYIIPATSNYNGLIFDTIDLNQGLMLQSINEEKHYGYYHWLPNTMLKLVVSTETRLDNLAASKNGQIFSYTEQRYDLSPRLMLSTTTNRVPKVILQSNPHQQQFYWGKSELIQYKNAKGKSLQGILFYPANYNPKTKYPMIVYIYEKLSTELHHLYIPPSQFIGDSDGFNISSFTTRGYFVLAPDISYEIGNPGISATDCVVSACNEMISRGLVSPDKIGLIGHSFGGYQTDFIITQTKLFAAAVAGAAAATDFSSDYLSIGIGSGIPEMWRYESQQMRMGKSLFEDRAGYDRNTPVVHASSITTPLLSWTGDADPQVDWHQSIKFYLALRRLEKKHIMLVYPKEGHSLMDKKNWNDLSVRIHNWFDYHLKDLPAAPWIRNGIK